MKLACKKKWNHLFHPQKNQTVFEISMPLPYVDSYERKQLIQEIKTSTLPIEKDDFALGLIKIIEDPLEWNLNLRNLIDNEILVFKDENVPIRPDTLKRHLFSSEITIHYNGLKS